MALTLGMATVTHAQTWGASPTAVRAGVASEREALASKSWTSGLMLRNVGPSVMGGRVVDVAVVEDTLYVAYATGGLWKSVNHGTSFTPLLDATCTLGAVDAHPSGRVVVGAGEVNSSRSSYAGDGIYISDDHGATWRHAGLEGSHHIGRVVIDPNNPNRIWVAALGELYSTNRGGAIYLSDNGGLDWRTVLTVPADGTNEVVGFVDLVMDAQDPSHLIAASWDRTRRAHDFTEGGVGTGIWETVDGGTSWNRISSRGNFPEGEHAGRIGLAYHSRSGTLYALIDNQAPRKGEDDADDGKLRATAFLDMDSDAFADLDNGLLKAFLEDEGFDPADSVSSVKARVASGDLLPRALYDYLTDGNRALFEADITGPELYRMTLANTETETDSTIGTWVRTHNEALDKVCYTYGYYFGTLSVDPADVNTLYIAGVPLLQSRDGGASFASIGAPNVHVDHHKLWVDPSNPNHLVNGNDGGVNVSWDAGAHWVKCNSPSVGQFYAVQVDESEPYRIFGGLQDNGTWVGASDHEENTEWHQTGHHGFTSLSGGDGMQIEVDTRTNDVIYTGSQFGWYTRLDEATGERASLHPTHKLGETPLRWNWQTPILLSQHQQDILYMASNKVHRSMNGGGDFEVISGDLTRGGMAGNVPFGTLTTMSEHPKHFGRLAVGSDDGLVHVSKDGGHTWRKLSLPVKTKLGKGASSMHLWVSEVAWSHHDAELLVVALNGYRHDCLTPMVYATRDEGQTWEHWGQHLPHEPVNALVESADREGWWIVGTDGGAYLSTDDGLSFSMLHKDLPRVPVHDLVIQERENELVIGTHGRGIYVLDLSPVLPREPREDDWKDASLSFEQTQLEVVQKVDWNERGWDWKEPTTPKLETWVWSDEPSRAQLKLRFIPTAPETPDSVLQHGGGASAILNQLQRASSFVVDCGEVDLLSGAQRLNIPLLRGDAFLDIGEYTVILATMSDDGKLQREATTTLTVLDANQP